MAFSDIGSFIDKHSGRVEVVQLRELSASYDALGSRIWVLEGADKTLMEMYLGGASFRQIASIAGVNEATVARRIKKITKRLMDSAYITCLRNGNIIGQENLEIACDLTVRGLSQQKTSRKRNVSLYHVRKVAAQVNSFAKSS